MDIRRMIAGIASPGDGREWSMSLYNRMGDRYMGDRRSDQDSELREWMIDRITAEAARREAALRKKIGEPKFKVGDRVWFKADEDIAYNNEDLFARFKRPVATVAIVDATGTFEQHDEPSYDLWLERADGSKLMWKHIRQSELEAVAVADGQA